MGRGGTGYGRRLDGRSTLAMSRPEKLVWAVCASLALGVLAGLLWLLRAPPTARAPVGMPSSPLSVELARPDGGDGVLQDEAILRDPRPLFLPTRLNASLTEPRREAGKALFEPDRVADAPRETDAAIVRELPPVAVLNGRSASTAAATDALAAIQGEVGVTGIGRGARGIEPLALRGGFLEAVSTASGSTVLAETLALSLAPAAGKAWEPLELLAVVDAGGLAVPLVVLTSSTVDEVDLHFRRILSDVFRIGERLPPGFFRLVVGP